MVVNYESNLGIEGVRMGLSPNFPGLSLCALQVLINNQLVNPINKQPLGTCRNIGNICGTRREQTNPTVHEGGSIPPTHQRGNGANSQLNVMNNQNGLIPTTRTLSMISKYKNQVLA